MLSSYWTWIQRGCCWGDDPICRGIEIRFLLLPFIWSISYLFVSRIVLLSSLSLPLAPVQYFLILPLPHAGSGFSWWWPQSCALATPTLRWRTSPHHLLLSLPSSTTLPPSLQSCPSPRRPVRPRRRGCLCSLRRSPNSSLSVYRRVRTS